MNGIIYIGFAASGVNLLIPGNDLGESPVIPASSSYGLRDNGGQVFNYYTNFSGTSLPSGWTNSIVTYTVNNGITIPQLAVSGKVYYNTANAYTGSTNTIDIFGTPNTITSGSYAVGYIDSNAGAGYSVYSGAGRQASGPFNWITGGFGSGFNQKGATGSPASSTTNMVITANSVSNSLYNSARIFSVLINYLSPQIVSSAGTSGTGHTESMGFLVDGTGAALGPFYWLRIRTPPPNGVFPQIIYGPQALPPGGPPYTFISSSANPTAYETSSQAFQFTVNVPALSNAVVATLTMNGITEANTTFAPTGLSQTFSLTQPIPLIGSNNLPYTFNAIMDIYYPNGLVLSTGTINTITQYEYWNYLPTATVQFPNAANVLLGSNVGFNTVITQVQPLNAITVAGDIQIGTGTVSDVTTGLYTYLANAISFMPSNFGLAMPTYANLAVNAIANSILQLSFNGNSVYRNVTGINLQVYNESLGPCGAYPSTFYYTPAVNWQFYNDTTFLPWPGNVLVAGSLTPKLNGYTGQIQPAQNIGFNSPATGNVYSTCQYPSWAQFTVQGILQYNGSQTLRSNFYANGYPISNAVANQRLYLESQPAPVQYDVFVLNQQTQTYIASQVNVYSYNIGNQTSTLLTQINVPALGGASVTLQAGNEYTFRAYTPNGQQFLGSAGPITAQQCSSPPCSQIVYANSYNITNPQNVFLDINTHCSNSTTSTANQLLQTCTFSSVSGASYDMELFGYNSGAYPGSPICWSRVIAASGTMSCTFNSITTNQYQWFFRLNQSGAYQTLQNGILGLQTGPYGIDAVWFGMLVVLTLVFLMLSRSIVITVIVFDMGWTAISLLQLVQVAPITVPMLWIISAVILFLLNRKG